MSRQGTLRERTLENIKHFWDKEAIEWGNNPCVTIRDHYFRLLEIETICLLVKNCKKLLDIGCGSGFSTLFYRNVSDEVVGIDYSKYMIENAQKLINDSIYLQEIMSNYLVDLDPPITLNNISFKVGDILNLNFPNSSFDFVIVERVLINLPTVDLQSKALHEISRVLKPNASCILVEVTKEGHSYVDKLRKQYNLPILEKYWHNFYIDESSFEDVLKKTSLSVNKILRFETYQFLTKVIHPLITGSEEPQFLAGINRAAHLISRIYPDYKSVMEVGYEKFLKDIFRKLVLKYAQDMLNKYDEVVCNILEAKPSFEKCSHQVLYFLQKG